MSIESVVEKAGYFGPFQICLVLATQSARMATVWGMFMMAFGNYNPGWDCIIPSHVLQNHSAFNNKARGVFISTPNPLYDSKSTDAKLTGQSAVIQVLNKGGEIGYSNISTFTRVTGSCDIIDSCARIEFDPSSVTVVTQWALLCDKSWVPSVMISVQMAGMLVGSSIAGQLSDSLGRRMGLYANTGLFSLANAMTVFSVSWEMFAALRFIVGFSAGGILSLAFVYPVEFLGPKARSVFAALPLWSISGALFFLTVMLLKNWWYVHLATAIISALSFLTVFWVPESIRWLVLNGKVNEAKKVVYRVAKMNGKPQPDTSLLYKIADTEKSSQQMRTRSRYTYLDLFTERELRKRIICSGFSWFFINVAYYAISFGVKSLYGHFYVNLILAALVETPAVLLIAPTVRIFGRRWGSALYIITACAFSFVNIIVFFAGSEEMKGTTITVCAICARTLLAAALALTNLYFGELVPTVVRSLSLGWVNMMARAGGIIAPYIIPSDQERLWEAFAVLSGMLLATFGLLVALPETTSLPLQDCMIVSATGDEEANCSTLSKEKEYGDDDKIDTITTEKEVMT